MNHLLTVVFLKSSNSKVQSSGQDMSKIFKRRSHQETFVFDKLLKFLRFRQSIFIAYRFIKCTNFYFKVPNITKA